MQHRIFKEIDESDLGHQGYHKTLQIIKSRFTWPKLDQTVRRFLKRCQTCLFHNNNYEVSKGYTPVIAPVTPFTRISIDFIGEFKRTQRNKKAALTIVDQSTRWLEAYSTKDMSMASAIYGLDLWIAKYTQPKVIVCDNGACFFGKDFRNFCHEKGIEIIFTSPNHPSSNDICERTHANINRMIAKHINDNQKNWDTPLPQVTSSLNSTANEVTKYSPFFLLYGIHPNLRVDGILPVTNQGHEDKFELFRNLVDARWQANVNTCRYQLTQKLKADRSKLVTTFEVGDLVLQRSF
ncbi:unnamed protein product [Allacma fusca]|uniref:RNA-directed DNA polymerase n=1 Tax=Allacma fusca TaxID=39272 RepID=A0A8J2KEE0_9HEXA|nr:unnamed protein product [Allacma fusca]